MKSGKWTKKVVSVTLAAVLGCGGILGLAACGGDGDRALVIMTEELNGLFNPFYSTAGTDMDVVGQTQISMLSTDSEGRVACGNNEACLVLDYSYSTTGTGDSAKTEYLFVLKNGLRYSDGYSVTMNDVLFNLYVYLDPAYTGSTTMYSTQIEGLQSYRTQTQVAGDGTEQEDALATRANGMANNRINELITVFHTFRDVGSQGSVTYSATEQQMRDKIATYSPTQGYLNAIAVNGNISVEDARTQLLADYNDTLTEFRKELENDYKAAKDSFSEEPYKSAKIYDSAVAAEPFQTGFDEVTAFMFMEGFADVEYERDAQQKEDRTKIKRINLKYSRDQVNSQEAAINHVYNATVRSGFDNILSYWATAGTMRTNFTAKARDVILHENLTDGTLPIKNISGITSLGHDANYTQSEITVNNTKYKIAKTHVEDASALNFGAPANEGEYDVLRIVVNGTDPKAIWNFGFTVAPYHYYSDPAKYPMNIKNNQFGVEWGSFDYMTKVIQGENAYHESKNRIPLGAGPYVATDINNNNNPGGNAFISGNVVYYKANPNFSLNGVDLVPPKINEMRYQVVSSSNAINQLKSGSVHFIEPQYTPDNYKDLTSIEKDGFKSLDTWQLGYGYIGINAGKVKNIYLRRAIMSAMNTRLAMQYYGTAATNIYWPMSLVSWAYPRTAGASYDPSAPLANKLDDNGTQYAGTFTGDEEAKTKIRNYMSQAAANYGGYSESDLKLTFTIAGSNLTEHPCFQVFKHAADLLNECGWSVEVMPDTNALTKLATGSLAVWAAAWGSTIDPDMYQVYDKHSTASSTYAWGYREILASESTYPEENRILNSLSEKIMDARETMDEEVRKPLYKEAMELVLQLAVELPVYQRKTLYAYNANVIDENSFPHDEKGAVLINSYASPLSRIWEIDFKK